jgi:DNA-binding NarL/FixJ family response regulator
MTMGISVKTVEFHKAEIMKKLGIKTAAELTRFALAQGLTEL